MINQHKTDYFSLIILTLLTGFTVFSFFNFSTDLPTQTASVAEFSSSLVSHSTLDEGAVDGKIGKAIEFDGSGNSIKISDSSSLDPANAISVSAWVKPGSADTGGIAIVNKMRALSGHGGWSLYRQSNEKYEFQIRNTASEISTSPAIASTDTTFADTNWHHVVGVYDGSNVKIYIDGVNADSTPPATTISLADGDNAVCIGNVGAGGVDSCQSSPANAFLGIIDDVRIYNKGLSASEVGQLYSEGGGMIVDQDNDTEEDTDTIPDPNNPPQNNIPAPEPPPIVQVIPPPPAVNWDPPIGIPTPSFGIEESYRMYDNTSNRNSSLTYNQNTEGGYYTHYIDVSSSVGTDTNNSFGTISKPRKTIPQELPAGSVVEIHGGPYTQGTYNGNTAIGVNANGTRTQPIFIRGLSQAQRPTLQKGMWFRGHYAILENLLWDMNNASVNALSIRLATSDPVGHNHHVAVRYSEGRNVSRTAGSSAMFSHSGLSGNDITDIVYYKNEIHPDDVDVLMANPDFREKDTVGISMGPNTNRIWVVDNHIYGSGGDGVGTGHGANYTARNYYIGRNNIHDNGENAVDFKEVDTVIVSQNKMYNMYGYSAGSGGGPVVAHYGPRYSPKDVWIIFNEIFNASDVGIQVGGSQEHEIYIIGNIIHDIHNSAKTAVGFITWGSRKINLLGNVFYHNDNGIKASGTGASGGPIVIKNNVIGDNLNPTGFFLSVDDSTYRTKAEISNNIFYQPGGVGKFIWGSNMNLAQIMATGKCAGCIEADPRFVNASSNNFNLQSSSPVTGAWTGSDLYQVFKDKFNIDIRYTYLEGQKSSPSISQTIVQQPVVNNPAITSPVATPPVTPPPVVTPPIIPPVIPPVVPPRISPITPSNNIPASNPNPITSRSNTVPNVTQPRSNTVTKNTSRPDTTLLPITTDGIGSLELKPINYLQIFINLIKNYFVGVYERIERGLKEVV